MTLKINSAYPIHETAIELLAQNNIQLRIVKNLSPFVLATTDDPDIVIHPLSKIMKDEFPSIRFCGPDCKFPNYEFVPEVGFSDLGWADKSSVNYKIVLVNTVGNIAFIKYLESCEVPLEIYGKPCDSLYYYGPLEQDSYELYRTAAVVAVDNEPEALKALKCFDGYYYGSNIISSFKYIGCRHFSTQLIELGDTKAYLNSKNWNTIFKKLFEKMELPYD